MLRIPAIVFSMLAIWLLLSAWRRVRSGSSRTANQLLFQTSVTLQFLIGILTLSFCILTIQFLREGVEPLGAREDLYGATIALFIGFFVLFTVSITEQRARLFNELNTMHGLAHQDALTGLYNRRSFDAVLNNFLVRTREPLTLIAIDIDNFKLVNDSHGHSFGDAVIRRVCDSLALQERAEDRHFRLGGTN